MKNFFVAAVPWWLNGKAQYEWIWAHPLKWAAILIIVNVTGAIVGSWLKGNSTNGPLT